jgi:hypothetical protein
MTRFPECGPLHCTCAVEKILPIKIVPTYHIGSADILQFFPIDKTPGFTHRVVLNGLAVDYLGDNNRPSVAVCRYYIEKHADKLKSLD